MSKQTGRTERWELDGRTVTVSNLDKPFWPEDGLTKGDLLAYYRRMGPVMLPYFQDRPVTLRLYPDGIHGFSYYRREPPNHAPAWLRTAAYRPRTADRPRRVILVDDLAGLIWLANQASIEFHLWASHLPHLHQPDMAIFDLDPGEEAGFDKVLQAALLLREALAQAGLEGFPKTSGGHGLHVYVPLAPGYTFPQVRRWVKRTAQELAAAHPQLIDVAHGATHQGSHVTVDYAQNSIARNTAAPYTLRARPGAPASTPLTWDEVAAGRVRPSDFTLDRLPARVQELGDLFRPVLERKQRLPELA